MLFEHLEPLHRRFQELNALISDPAVIADPERLKACLRERGSLEKKAALYEEWRRIARELAEARAGAGDESDPEMRELFRSETVRLEAAAEALEVRVRDLLVADDPDAGRNVILEVRAGTGGDEASLFAADLLRMYTRYAEDRGWDVELIDESRSEVGGFREVTVRISGPDVFRRLRFESGGHRVQRVPATETQGRIHTSAATVAVLPEATEVDVDLRDADIEFQTMRSSGPGGQNVNKVSSAVRLTHRPSGLVVTCQEDRSQHKNRARALMLLRTRLYDQRVREEAKRRSELRRSQIGSGDRSERIRTYNFPQSRVTDHRLNLSLHNLESILDGNIDPLIDPMIEIEKQERLRALADGAKAPGRPAP